MIYLMQLGGIMPIKLSENELHYDLNIFNLPVKLREEEVDTLFIEGLMLRRINNVAPEVIYYSRFLRVAVIHALLNHYELRPIELLGYVNKLSEIDVELSDEFIKNVEILIQKIDEYKPEHVLHDHTHHRLALYCKDKILVLDHRAFIEIDGNPAYVIYIDKKLEEEAKKNHYTIDVIDTRRMLLVTNVDYCVI